MAENTNQNKFSFGEDSENVDVGEEQSQNEEGNGSYIEERHDYELPEHHQVRKDTTTSQRPQAYGVNLMNEFDRCESLMRDEQEHDLRVVEN